MELLDFQKLDAANPVSVFIAEPKSCSSCASNSCHLEIDDVAEEFSNSQIHMLHN